MLSSDAQAATITKLLNPISAANTAAATSGWVNMAQAVGDILFIVGAGALTGSIVWTIENASDSGGTGAATITPNEGAFAAAEANQVQKRTIASNHLSSKPWVRVVGTIVTGPVLVSACVMHRTRS